MTDATAISNLPPLWQRALAWMIPVLLTLGIVALANSGAGTERLTAVRLSAPDAVENRHLRYAENVLERSQGDPIDVYGTFALSEQPPADLLLSVQRLGGAFELSLNGHPLLAPHVPGGRVDYSLVALPQAYLRVGENRLRWRLDAGPAMIILPTVERRGELAIVQQHQQSMFLPAAAAATLAVGLLLSGIWLTRRHALEFLLFALGVFAWNAFLMVSQGPWRLPSPTATHLVAHLLLQAFVLFLALFARRFCGKPFQRVDALLLVLAALGAVGLLLAYALADIRTLYGWVSQLHRLLLIGFGLAILSALVQAARGSTEITRDLMTGTAFTGVLLGIHDAISFLAPAGQSTSLIGYGLPVALASMGAVIVLRYAGALREAEQLNRELDARVQAKAQALETLYVEHAALQQKRTLDAERERILRDMHDGVGGQLVALMAASQRRDLSSTELQASASAALRDLRWMIDSLDVEVSDLAVALASFASRVRPMLEQAGLQLQLDTGSLPDGIALPPERLLQLFRFFDEALQNVMKHAQAGTVVLAAAVIDGCVALSLRDDGRGFDPDRQHGGRGIQHLRRRAAALDADLKIASGPGGTELRLYMPLADR
jgi:hypothetical protein